MEQRQAAGAGPVGLDQVARDAPGLEVRRLAADRLRACVDQRLTVEDALQASPQAMRLDTRDRAFLVSLLLTAFRHRGEIDAMLRELLDKPLPRKSGLTRELLELGIAQLLFLEMPPHAVIDSAVRAAKADRNAMHFTGLINAVLRKISTAGTSLLAKHDAPHLNTPAWLWERWCKNFGAATAREIALAHGVRPALDLIFKDDPAAWRESLSGLLLPNGQLRLPPGHAPVPELPGFRDGAWWVQDAAATIPVRLMGNLKGRKVLDLCAAPGGKTLQLAAGGAEVTAIDVSEPRLARLRDNLARTGLSASIQVADVLKADLSQTWDAVLLDAPCSATGTIRRHPELPWIRQEKQIAELAALQRQMLSRAAALVRPGCLIVYCTCSLEPEEGEAQVRQFLARNPDFDIIPATLPDLPPGAIRPEGWVRTLPAMSYGGSPGMDGFFTVAMRRQT
jgi:16S rRNA (cytosine967-C5)-methyltransferase